MPTFGSLFAGIGGLDLGLERAGWTCTWQVEIDPACRSVLERHWPGVERHSDVRQVGAAQLARVDLVCGGFPCQDISVAGRRAGLGGERSGLWWEFHRILAELAPRWVLIENVPGLLSSCGCEECRPPADAVDGEEDEEAVAAHTKPEHRGRDLLALVEGLAELGYGWAFRVLDAQYFGVAQRRRRVFVVGHLGEPWSAPGEVLFEPESVSGDPAPRRTAREDVAGTLGGGTPRGGLRPDTDRMTFVPTAAKAITATPHSPHREDAATYVAALTSRCGSTMDDQQTGQLVVGALTAATGPRAHGGSGMASSAEAGHVIAYNIFPEHGQGADLRAAPTDVSTALSSERGRKSHERGTRIVQPAYALRADAGREGVAKTPSADADGRVRLRDPGFTVEEERSPTLDATGPATAIVDAAVRRLTPLECERLQGFPDGHTDGQSDSTRYRELGNAVCVPVAQWIGRRLR